MPLFLIVFAILPSTNEAQCLTKRVWALFCKSFETAEGEPLLVTMFSTRDRAERELLDGDLGEADGYFIGERQVSDEEYSELLATEALWDEADDGLIFGR